MEITEVLDRYKVAYVTEGHRHARTGWVNFDCPFCGRETFKYHMGYSIRGGYTVCWRCGSHSAVMSLAELVGISYVKAKELLSDVGTFDVDEIVRTGKLVLPKRLGPLQKPHIQYLRNRGYQKVNKLEKLWGLQGIGISDRLSWRIFIPIQHKGETVSWTTRAISDKVEQRYIRASKEEESLCPTSVLYGEDLCRHAIVICEGPFDAWKIGPGAVALMGLNFSNVQINQMIKYPIRAVCFDNQPAAQDKANQLVDILSVYPGDTYNIQLDAKDAGSASDKEIRSIKKLIT